MLGVRNNTVSLIDTYNKLMAYKQIGKARRKVLERASKPAPGLTATQRADAYREQNGSNKLTPRQRARIAKKEGHAVAQGGRAA